MSGLTTSIVTDAHAYTRVDVPWNLEDEATKGNRLIRYLSGGGMKTFGRTIRQEKNRRRHIRFLVVSAVLAVAWLYFYFA